MTRFRALSALILWLAVPTAGYAQEQQRVANVLVLNALELGAGVAFVMEGTTADGFEFRMRVDPTADVNWTLPASAGSAGTQLQTSGVAGEEILSWASAGSTREQKLIAGLLDPSEALQAILDAPVHRFKYKPGAGTQDSTTEYAGILADEAPWAMHHNGTILNPVNTAGYTFGAIQALQAEIAALKLRLAEPSRRTWRTLWLWRTR